MTRNALERVIWSLVCGTIGAGIGIVCVLYADSMATRGREPAERSALTAMAPPAAAPAPPASPPCVREHCAERIARLKCEDEEQHGYSSSCIRWKVLYEHHCDCVEWGPR